MGRDLFRLVAATIVANQLTLPYFIAGHLMLARIIADALTLSNVRRIFTMHSERLLLVRNLEHGEWPTALGSNNPL